MENLATSNLSDSARAPEFESTDVHIAQVQGDFEDLFHLLKTVGPAPENFILTGEPEDLFADGESFQ